MGSNGFPISSNREFGPAPATDRPSRLTRFTGKAISLAIFAFTSPGAAAECLRSDPGTSFHRPTHAAERTLDRLIKKEGTDDNMFLFEVKRPDRDLRNDKTYRGFFTPALEKAWAETEAALVKQDCDGNYQDGELCGLEFRPLACAQDYSEKGYLYRMDCQTESSSTISIRWPWIEQPVATYRLIRQGKAWVLDGVTCLPDGPAFNMPEPRK